MKHMTDKRHDGKHRVNGEHKHKNNQQSKRAARSSNIEVQQTELVGFIGQNSVHKKGL